MFEKVGFDFLTSQKLYMILQTWRKEMPKDISEDELSRKDSPFRERPNSAVHAKNLPNYRESFSCVSDNFNALGIIVKFLQIRISSVQSIKWWYFQSLRILLY
jgi:hypothetical protein